MSRLVAVWLVAVLLVAGTARWGGILPQMAAGAEAAAENVAPADGQSAEAALPESPLSPEQALASFQVEPGVRVELVAAEPLVESPVAVAFDAQGRMFVAEDRGYPTGPVEAGRVSLLEDSDGDGRYDVRHPFADGLSYPNGLLPWRNGLLVTSMPDLIYLEDRDGDGRSDYREVLLTGFSVTANGQHGESHPQLGLDGWIYVTGGLVGGKITSPKNPDHPMVEFGRGDFRFLPDCSHFEAVNGGGQFGMTQDDAGHRFICYNRVQVQHVVLPDRYLKRNGHLTATATVQDCPAEMVAEPLKGHGASARLYPISHNITTADSHAGTFTAACGVLVYRSTGLPAGFAGGVFSCDPTANLVHFDKLEPAGATFAARRSPEPREFLASSDDWFRPVNLAQGPDGALYVCDMYRRTIEHPDYLPLEIRKHTDFEGGKGMGRIWRVVGNDSKAPNMGELRGHFPADLPEKEATAAIDRPEAWWRDTAQRLLVERDSAQHKDAQQNDAQVAAELAVLAYGGTPAGVVKALWLLDSWGGLDETLILQSLGHKAAMVREQAILLAEKRLEKEPALVEKVAALASDPDARVRFQCALTLGEAGDNPAVIEALVKIAASDAGDRWARAAVLSSIGGHELEFLQRFAAAGPSTGKTPTKPGAGDAASTQILSELAALVGAAVPEADWPTMLHAVVAAIRARPFTDQAGCVTGLSESLRRRRGANKGSVLQAVIGRETGAEGKADREFFNRLFAAALKTAVDKEQPAELRGTAVNVLADADSKVVGEALVELAGPHEPPEVQVGAVRALANLEQPEIAARLLDADRFAAYSPSLREAVLAAMLSEPHLQAALLTALEAGAVPIGMVDSLRRRQLTAHRDPALRQRAAKVFAASAVGNRAHVYDDYKSVAGMTGEAANGHKVFMKSCANCHRLDREGTPVGPDLFGIRNQPKEAILLHILIPEYEITPGFGAYMVETTDGRILAGLLVGENANQVTLRAALGREETVLRSDIESLKLSQLSLMPQELEKTMTRQEMADLLAYLKGESP